MNKPFHTIFRTLTACLLILVALSACSSQAAPTQPILAQSTLAQPIPTQPTPAQATPSSACDYCESGKAYADKGEFDRAIAE